MTKNHKPARELSDRAETRLMRVATAIAIVTVALCAVSLIVYATVGAS